MKIELDSLLIKLTKNSITNIQSKKFEFQSNLKIYNKKRFYKSDSFKTMKYCPSLLGYIYIFNYKVKILIWTSEEIHILYDRIFNEIKKSINESIQDSGDSNDIVNNFINVIGRLPPSINPNGIGISIVGSETIMLFLKSLISLIPAVFYIRGSKLPLTKFCNDIIKFNEFLFNLINSNVNQNENLCEEIYENNILEKLKNRIDWAFNFYEVIYDCLIEEDIKFMIVFIENYFLKSFNVKLVIKNKIRYRYHYYIENSNCFRGDLYLNSNKIGQVITYYNNSIYYRNDNIGISRISPLGLSTFQVNEIDKNSDITNMLTSYSFHNNVLQNGLVRRLEIRAFQFNKLTIQFPVLLEDLCVELIDKFMNRKKEAQEIYNKDITSEKVVPKTGFLPLFLSKERNENFNCMLLKNNFIYHNFKEKTNTILKLYENSITELYVDVTLQIILEEILFISYNGLRNIGVKYSFSNSIIESFFKVIIELDYRDSFICEKMNKRLKVELNNIVKNKLNSLEKDENDNIFMENIIEYNMVPINFMFKEIYSIESAFRILCILSESNCSLLNLVLEKEFILDEDVDDLSSDDVIYIFFENVVKKILFNQIFSDIYVHFSGYDCNFEIFRHEWKEYNVKFANLFKFKLSVKKFAEISQIEEIKLAIFNKRLNSLPYKHVMRQRERKHNVKEIKLSDWVDKLFFYLSFKNENIELSNTDRNIKFLSSKMMLNIINYYCNLLDVNINIKNIFYEKLIQLVLKYRNLSRSMGSNKFEMIVPEIQEDKFIPTHTQGIQGFLLEIQFKTDILILKSVKD